MGILSQYIDEELEESKRIFPSYFEKDGQPRLVKTQSTSRTTYESAGFKEFYHALSRYCGAEIQAKYTQKARFYTGVSYLVQPSVFLAMVVGLISIPLAFITQGEGWPDWIVNLAMAVTIGPLIGTMMHHLIIESWFDNIFENIYERELARKKSKLITTKSKYHFNFLFLFIVALFVFLFFVEDWYEVVALAILALLLPLYTMLLGFILLVLVRVWRFFFPKKVSPKKELNPVSEAIVDQLKLRLTKIYQAMQEGNYDAAFDQFDSSEISREEYVEEIKSCFQYFAINQFHLPPLDFSDEEMFEVNPESDTSCEVILFLHEQNSKEACVFYFICSVDYSDDEILEFSLVTVGC